MAKQIINIGQAPNDKSGDLLRTAFTKINENFSELYVLANADVQIPAQTNNGDKFLTTNGSILSWDTVGKLVSETAELVLTGGNNPFVTFPANGTDQLFIQGSEIAATSGSIALTSIDGSIFLTTHGNLAPSLAWEFDRSGTLTTPLGLPKTFTATLDTEHFVGDLTLTSSAWYFEVQFQVNPNGTVQTMIGNNTPWLTNPGYVDGQQFEYTEADHGIPGYTFTLGLADVLLAGPAGWTTNLTASIPPEYPSTAKSLGAIKLTSDTNSWTFGTDGNLTLPDGESNIYSADPNTSGGINGIGVVGKDRIYLTITNSDGSFMWDFRDYGLGDYSTNRKPAIMFPGGSWIEEDLTNQSLNLGMLGPLIIGSQDKLILRTSTLDEAQSPTATYDWEFGKDGHLTFPDSTVQTTAYTGITNTHDSSATLAVGINTAIRGNLTLRLTNNSNTLDIEINYQNPDTIVSVSAYKTHPLSLNVYTGRTLKSPGNTDWDIVGNLSGSGDILSFIFTDHSFYKIYRVTIIADVMPGVGAVGEAFCMIEELK